MGARGPVGKRPGELMGHGAAKARAEATTVITLTPEALDDLTVVAPEGNPDWHPIALDWFTALRTSGQSLTYEPSDWAVALFVAESMSRDLKPQPVGVTDSGKVVTDTIPLKGASLTAYLKAFTALLVTEADRRRVGMEIQRAAATERVPHMPSEEEIRAARERGEVL